MPEGLQERLDAPAHASWLRLSDSFSRYPCCGGPEAKHLHDLLPLQHQIRVSPASTACSRLEAERSHRPDVLQLQSQTLGDLSTIQPRGVR